MITFRIGKDDWQLRVVNPGSNALIDRTGSLCLATTDPHTMTVCISNELSGDMLTRVLIHEMAHCAIWSYNMADDIHRMVKPEYWIKAEEWICNFIADYGYEIFKAAQDVLGSRAIVVIPDLIDALAA